MKGKQLITLPNKGNIIFPPTTTTTTPPCTFFFPPFSSVSADLFFSFLLFFPLYSLFSFASRFPSYVPLQLNCSLLTNNKRKLAYFVNSVVGKTGVLLAVCLSFPPPVRMDYTGIAQLSFHFQSLFDFFSNRHPPSPFPPETHLTL